MTHIAMSPVFLSSVLIATGCTHDDAPGLRMLDTRADYEATSPEKQTLILAAAENGADGAEPVRLPPKVAHIWLHAHETPEHEYFWGAWLSVVVSGEEWGVRHDGVGQKAPVPSKP